MEKVYVLEEIWEYDGQVETKVKLFSTFEKAQEEFNKLKVNNFVEDIQRDIDNGNEDSHIDEDKKNEELYFYAYDSFNFEALTITVDVKEIL